MDAALCQRNEGGQNDGGPVESHHVIYNLHTKLESVDAVPT